MDQHVSRCVSFYLSFSIYVCFLLLLTLANARFASVCYSYAYVLFPVCMFVGFVVFVCFELLYLYDC
jgi:hypothetical protein